MKKQTESDINERKDRLIEAASSVFLRYGYTRTTLGDIALEAKLHRPNLYALFPAGKDELFEAVLLNLVETEVERYRQGTSKMKTLRQKLLHCVSHWTMGGFRIIEANPDARDAFNMAYPAVRKMYEVLVHFYAELLEESVATSTLKMSSEQLARLLVFSVRGIKDIATDTDTMQELLTLEVDLFLAALHKP
ncbi:MAG: TetR/AcrR family transcriptional regulator [Candidatus Obscuribacterales bacterium]|nr:TetR/AcrR family transcriptional regulator [Candidatus Obscuribacterales bacterium]